MGAVTSRRSPVVRPREPSAFQILFQAVRAAAAAGDKLPPPPVFLRVHDRVFIGEAKALALQFGGAVLKYTTTDGGPGQTGFAVVLPHAEQAQIVRHGVAGYELSVSKSGGALDARWTSAAELLSSLAAITPAVLRAAGGARGAAASSVSRHSVHAKLGVVPQGDGSEVANLVISAAGMDDEELPVEQALAAVSVAWQPMPGALTQDCGWGQAASGEGGPKS